MRQELTARAQALTSNCEDKAAIEKMLMRALDQIAEEDEDKAESLIEHFEGECLYNNYLSEEECMEVLSGFKNTDGSTGAKWKDPAVVFKKVTSIGGEVESVPNYNRWTLYATINAMVSDYEQVIAKFSEGDTDKFFEVCYDLAVARLSDPDRPEWIRSYYDVK